jgi:hypothetical protein
MDGRPGKTGHEMAHHMMLGPFKVTGNRGVFSCILSMCGLTGRSVGLTVKSLLFSVHLAVCKLQWHKAVPACFRSTVSISAPAQARWRVSRFLSRRKIATQHVLECLRRCLSSVFLYACHRVVVSFCGCMYVSANVLSCILVYLGMCLFCLLLAAYNTKYNLQVKKRCDFAVAICMFSCYVSLYRTSISPALPPKFFGCTCCKLLLTLCFFCPSAPPLALSRNLCPTLGQVPTRPNGDWAEIVKSLQASSKQHPNIPIHSISV